MNDRELLELAAKAAGIHPHDIECTWNALTDDGDAFRLAVKLRLEIDHNHQLDDSAWVMATPNGVMAGPMEDIDGESHRLAATRRAVVRAAAELGKAMKG